MVEIDEGSAQGGAAQDTESPDAHAGAGWPPAPPIRAENFPVALRVLPAATRRHLLALYGYARYVDDLGDEPTSGLTGADRLALLDAFEAELRGLYSGQPAQHPVLRELAPTIHACQLPIGPLQRLIECNRVDQLVTRYETFDQLVSYCELSANPVGELVLHIFGSAQPHRVALSDRICTALQLVEHLQDIAEDHRRGRIYLPTADLERFGVQPSELSAPVATGALRQLIRFQADRAGVWLVAGAPLVSTLRGWGRLAVGGYVAGGRAALAALAASGFDPLPAPPKPGRRQLLRHWLAVTMGRSG